LFLKCWADPTLGLSEGLLPVWFKLFVFLHLRTYSGAVYRNEIVGSGSVKVGDWSYFAVGWAGLWSEWTLFERGMRIPGREPKVTDEESLGVG
jgi:hypothetical protein